MPHRTLLFLNITASFLLACGGVQAEVTEYDRSVFQTLEYGFRCKQETTGSALAPNTVVGSVDLIDPFIGFRWKSSRVPAVLGLSFGVRTIAVPGTQFENVDVVVTHPPLPESAVTSQSWSTSITDSNPNISSYAFDYPFELVPGSWSFEARSKGRVFYHVNFEVIETTDAATWSKACEIGGLSS